MLSALIALVGLGLTVYGLRLQRSATRPTAPPPPPAPTDPTRLEVPDRSSWVPPSEYLPPGYSPNQGYGGPPMQQPQPSRSAPRRTVLVIGLVMLAVAVALGVVTWIL
ncbi:hypothetical protein [Saccharopolyspora shandongensis]|uniref:hypothetical protein n=1 Tax=Saccharopolyspora shandongensis TaxID=418495 RepID=UPI0033D727DF